MKEIKIKEIAESNMDKMDIYYKYDGELVYPKVLIRRKIKQYADAYGAEFSKYYAKVRCERNTIETLLREVHYATCPDWFGDYFEKVYREIFEELN